MNESDDAYSMSYYDGFLSGIAIAIGIVKGGVAGWVAHEIGSMDRKYIDKFDLEHFEVVGNIFDNKELLQEESDE